MGLRRSRLPLRIRAALCLLFTCRASPGARTQGARFSSPAAADRKLAIREDREEKPQLHSAFVYFKISPGPARKPLCGHRELVAPWAGSEAAGGSERKVRRCDTMRLLITKALRASRGHCTTLLRASETLPNFDLDIRVFCGCRRLAGDTVSCGDVIPAALCRIVSHV